MTEGNPTKKILQFTLPIFLGNLFQQIYSVSDTFVVGRFIGKEALAAVGACSAIVVFITSILIGLCMGSGVYFSDLYGSKDNEKLARAISTASIFIFGITCVLMIASIALIEPLMRVFNIPEAVMGMARDYLLIILYGMPFMFLYNMATAILRALGDSRTPLIFLIVASVVNVAFDFILVTVIPMGVRGPALSTFGAQLVSGVPLAIYAVKKLSFMKLRPIFDVPIFRTVARYSLLTSLQQSIMNFGILMVQGLVNSFGVVTMAAFAVGVKIDAFAYMPAQDFGNAFSTYIAQNKGAGNTDRIRQGFRSAILCATIFSLVLTAFVFAFAPQLIALFSTDDAAVIQTGAEYLRIEGMFYVLIGYLFLFYGFYRGLGAFKTSIVLTVVSLGTRVLLSYALVAMGYGVTSIWASIVVGWALADVLGFVMYHKMFGKKTAQSAA